jgi:hypothetical protein
MKPKIKKMTLRIPTVAMLVALAVGSTLAQDASTTQTLTLQVTETNRIDVSQRSLTMVINQASLETGNPVEATDDNGNLIWITNGENKKITVATNNAAPRFLVKVQALDITGSTGVAAPEITLKDNTVQDLVMGVTRSWGKCKIRFMASAKVSDGVGTETHLITYTITGG